jgi:signal transduction histidine kinase
MKEKALQILLVEDNAGDVRLVREMFTKERADSFELTHCLRMGEAERHLAKGGVDIVLLDMGLPDGHGLESVRRAHAAAPGVPMIVLTGLDDEALAAEAMKEGAQDYLIKGQIENRALPRALRHAIERHRMQKETDLIQIQQLQFKDEFLSHVSHELRSPLSAIRQFATILLDGLAGELQTEQQKYMGIVLKNVKQLQSMISDLLAVTRVQVGSLMIEPQCTSVADAIEYAIDTLQRAATAKGITLSFDIASRLPSACADPTRIRQILIILVDNAIKFTPTNGEVKVQARVFDKDPSLIVLQVSDSGCGIGPDMTERIFERLFQTSDPSLEGRKGLGLGLYICKDLVTRQGGQIWAKSDPEQGTVFSVTLPIFSLPNLMSMAFRKEVLADRPVTLVVTELGSQSGWLSNDVRAEQAHAVREILQRCLHSRLDVLLPKMGLTEAAELFFIVAITDSVGGEALSKRIREQLREHVGRAGLTVSTSHRSLSRINRTSNESAEEHLEQVAVGIQQAITEEISSRMVVHG